MVNDQLHRHHRVDLSRVTALIRNRIAQACKIDQSGLSKDVVTHDPRRIPGKVTLALALNQLSQRILKAIRIAPAN